MRKVTVLVLGVLAAASAVAAVAVTVERQATTRVAKGERVFPGLADRLNNARAIEVAKAGSKYTIAAKGDGWVLPDKSDYPARTDLVRQLLVSMAEIERVEGKTANAALYERLNLRDLTQPDSKAQQLTVRDAQGQVLASLLIGKKRTPPPGSGSIPTGMEMLYVRKPGEAQTWLVLGQLDLKPEAVDWADRDVMDLKQEKVARVEVTRPDGSGYVVSKEGDAKDFTLADMPEGMKVKSQWDVNAVASAIESLTFEDVTPAASLPAGEAATTTAVYKTTDGLTLTVALVPRDGNTWAKFTASGEGEAAAQAKTLTEKLGNWAYRLPDYKRERLETKREALLEPVEKPAS